MNNKDQLYNKLFGDYDSSSLKLFKEYHLARPDILNSFKEFANKMYSTGRLRYSGKCIMERIRWEHDLNYSDSEFKISNSMTSFYVRLLIWNEPRYLDFFQLKKVTGIKSVGSP